MELWEAHIEAQARLRRLTVSALLKTWDDLPAYDRADVPAFLEQALPLMSATERQSVLLTNAFVSRALERPPIEIPIEEIVGSIRNGVDPREVYERPFVTLWGRLANGESYDQALGVARARLEGTGAMDLQATMRATSEAIDERDDSFYGYTRKADSGACKFCEAVDGAYVKAADGFAMALHNFCGCGLEPNTEPHKGAVKLPDGTRVRAYQYGPLNDQVAVHEHGELGPVLGDPQHDFDTAGVA